MKIKSVVIKALNKLNVKQCVFCGETSNNNICDICKLLYIEKVKIGEEYINLNLDIHQSSYVVEKNLTAHYYLLSGSSVIRKYITDIKYYGKVCYINGFIDYIGVLKFKKYFKDYDLYTYIPTSIYTFLKRGYNISEYLIDNLGFEKICVFSILDDKIKLKKLNKSERIEKIPKKLALNKNLNKLNKKIDYKMYKYLKDIKDVRCFKNMIDFKILIVDDVYTTGITLNYAKKLICEYIEKYILKKSLKINSKNTNNFKDLDHLEILNNINIYVDYLTVIKE